MNLPSVDWFSHQALTWTSQNAAVFLPQALALFRWLNVLYLIWYAAIWALESLIHMRTSVSQSALKLLLTILVTGVALNYYVTPTRMLGGLSIDRLLPDGAAYLANVLDQSSLHACIVELDNLVGAQHPPTWHSPWL